MQGLPVTRQSLPCSEGAPTSCRAATCSTSRSGTASAASPFATAEHIDLRSRHDRPLARYFPAVRRTDEWLALAQMLARYDPQTLEGLGFPERESATLARVIDAIRQLIPATNRNPRSLAEQPLSRLWEAAPDYAVRLAGDEAVGAPPLEDRWLVPQDIAAPPTTERVTPTASLFTREDVDLVLKDL